MNQWSARYIWRGTNNILEFRNILHKYKYRKEEVSYAKERGCVCDLLHLEKNGSDTGTGCLSSSNKTFSTILFHRWELPRDAHGASRAGREGAGLPWLLNHIRPDFMGFHSALQHVQS